MPQHAIRAFEANALDYLLKMLSDERFEDRVRFVSVHRSAIVNIESILHLEPISHVEFDVIENSAEA
jgi:DNA-binding LytR/AlgR family response regulator